MIGAPRSLARRSTVVLLLAALTLPAWPGPAAAQTKTRKDTVGDATAATDIRSITVANGPASYAVTVRMTEVIARHTTVTFVFGSTRTLTAYELEAVPVARGRWALRGGLLDNANGTPRFSCPGARVQVDRGRRGHVRLVVPQRCLGQNAGRLLSDVYTFDKHPPQDRRGDADEAVVGDTTLTSIETRRD